MSPGALIAIGCWLLILGWLIWTIARAPVVEDEPEPDEPIFAFGVLISMDGWDSPHERRHTGGVA
ncbi:MAG: hypothetical protein ACYCQK_01850 [Acidiferrobacteraceae bacterium]